MDPEWTHLLAKTRAPQPEFQRLAVKSLFAALRRSPSPSSAAISAALASSSAAAADQAVRELCRLATADKTPFITPLEALFELQCALDSCPAKFVGIFVKGVGFLVRFQFRSDAEWRRRGVFENVGMHPFVKVLSCRAEVREELIQQVLLFIVHGKSFGMETVVEFLRPFVLFAIVCQSSPASSAVFLRDLFSSIVSLACSFPSESISILKLLTRSLCNFCCSNNEEFNYLCACAESLVDAFVVVLEHIAPVEPLTSDIQACGMDLVEYLLSICTEGTICQGRIEIVLQLTKRLLVTQKELGLHYIPDFVKVAVSLTRHLTHMEFEHEQLSVMKLLLLLQDWKTVQESTNGASTCCLSEELLCLFPVISLMSSPSKSIKASAAKLLSSFDHLLLDVSIDPMKEQLPVSQSLSASRLESIVFRTLRCLWFQKQSFFCSFLTLRTSQSEKVPGAVAYWTSHLKEYLKNFGTEKSKSSQQFSQVSVAGSSFLLSSLAFILVLHPELGTSAVECLATLGVMDPKLGTPLLLAVLFYTKIFCKKDCGSPEMTLKLLETLPLLAAQPVMVPLILQTLLPMLQENVKPVLYAAAVRLLCKTWTVTDSAFGTLQSVLDPKSFSRFSSVEEISESLAVSVCDVCRHDPDRGVDIILSVSSCIESSFSRVQALGLESVAYLCEADVVDFYTAWKIIIENMRDYSADPIIAHGLCTLLRWGAMDADAYPEDAKTIINILWQLGTSTSYRAVASWLEVRKTAFLSLSHFKVENILEAIPDFKTRNLHTLVSEDNVQLLNAIEEFEVEIIKFEHMTRRRMHKQKRNKVHKVEKLLDVFPRVIFSTGKFEVNQLPGAALLSSVFTPKDLVTQGTSKKDLAKLHAAYEGALLEIAESLEVSRSLLVALFTVQSWKPFVQRWMLAAITLATKSSSTLDATVLAANDILKRLCKIFEDSLPQVAVNVVLSIGAFCMVLPPTAHLVISAASDILLKWLFESEHEHLQWSSAISLGLLSTNFDVTNEKQKFEVIAGLLKVLRSCKSYLTIGACGIGLGFASQNLLKRVKSDGDPNIGGAVWAREASILHDIISALSQKICHLCPSVCESLMALGKNFPIELNELGTSEFLFENKCNLEEDAWGVSGLVMGLGSSSIPLCRLGAYDSVSIIRNLLISWVSAINSPRDDSALSDDPAESSLCLGSCLILPTVVTFCQRTELAENDFDVIFELYASLISDLLNVKKSAKLYQNLLMGSCVGVGLLLSQVMNLGLHSMEYDAVKHLLDMLRNAYTQSYHPLICLGGMIGVVNAFGAGAGELLQAYPQSILRVNENMSSSSVSTAVLSNPYYETISTAMIQEILLLVKESKNNQLQSYAAWAASFLRHHLLSNEFLDFADLEGSSMDMKISSQSLSEESLVFNLCLWLRDVEFSKTGEVVSSNTIAAILRCLSHAPRLPDFDWDSIIRRLMRYESQLNASMGIKDAVLSLRIECVKFSLSHAKHVGSLLYILDELVDLPRFRRLELNLQSLVLEHFSDLLNLFSTKRAEKMFDDLVEYFISSNSLYLVYEESQQCLLRVSFWKGLSRCLVEVIKEPVISSKMERAMKSLFSLLPMLLFYNNAERLACSSEEWSVAMRFLSKAPESWLVDLLQIPVIGVLDAESLTTLAKNIIVKAKLVASGCFPAHVLGEMKAQILNATTDGMWWAVLIEVSAALTTREGGIVGQWILDALDTSCVSIHPSTALRLVGLLASSCCKYMPLLIIDPTTVLNDLPVTLPSLLSDNRWHSISTPLVAKLYNATERMCTLAKQGEEENSSSFKPAQDVVEASEMKMSDPLARILYQTCICLQNYLPSEKRLKLINLEM